MPPHDPHRGGCAFCRWIARERAPWRCANPAYPIPILWDHARDDAARCGPSGRLWEPRLELTAPEGPPA